MSPIPESNAWVESLIAFLVASSISLCRFSSFALLTFRNFRSSLDVVSFLLRLIGITVGVAGRGSAGGVLAGRSSAVSGSIASAAVEGATSSSSAPSSINKL
jgi:hypothetical protein